MLKAINESLNDKYLSCAQNCTNISIRHPAHEPAMSYKHTIRVTVSQLLCSIPHESYKALSAFCYQLKHLYDVF